MHRRSIIQDFFHNEKTSGLLLLACTIISLCIANFIASESYTDFWHRHLAFGIGPITIDLTVEQWINDGLMTIFFLMVGLEIERELYIGELSTLKNASLPVIAAVGGMIVPALFHFLFNNNTPTQSGFGIPMATDIAFAIGIISLAGKRVPISIKIFLTALAIIDDLGAIIIIGLFYSGDISALYLFSALGIFLLLFVLGRLKVYYLLLYIIGGIVMWYCMLKSGVHPTITGVLLAFAIPFGKGQANPLSARLQRSLHIPVAFFIVPLFVFANTGLIISGSLNEILINRNSLGIMTGLLLGKPIGIFLFSYIAIRSRISSLPAFASWSHLIGAGILAGIGFTMSIFISLLAFDDPQTIQHSKMAILFSSFIAGIIGYLYFIMAPVKRDLQ